jgi:hypothetical protein
VKKVLLLALLICCSVPPLRAADEPSVRVFVLKHRRVEDAALLIRWHISESATVTLTQKLNAMTVTDRPDRLQEIGRILAAYDVPPRGFQFAIKLVRARADVPAGSIAQEIGGLGAKLKSLFQFNDYALIDSGVIRGAEGGLVQYRMGEEYQLSFSIKPAGAGDELLLSPFILSRLKKNERGSVVPSQLYRAAIPVTLNQTLVVGASKEEASKSALILVLLAQETPRSGAPDGQPGPAAAVKRP